MFVHEMLRKLQLGQIFHCNPDTLDDLPSWEATWYIELDNLRKQHEVRGL